MAKAKLGSGARFKAVEKSAAKSGARDPAAVAAAAGITAGLLAVVPLLMLVAHRAVR